MTLTLGCVWLVFGLLSFECAGQGQQGRWRGELPKVNLPFTDVEDLKARIYGGKGKTTPTRILNSDFTINYAVLDKFKKPNAEATAQAVKIINEASALYPNNPELALKKFMQSIERDPFIPNPWDVIGYSLAERGQTNLAIEYTKQAIKNTGIKEAGYYHIRLGSYYVSKRSEAKTSEAQKEFLELACESFRLAADYTLSKPEFKTQLAICYYEMGKLNEALLELNKVNWLMPNDANTLTQLGMIQKELLLYKEAEQSLLEAIAINPQLPDPYRILATLYQYVFFDLSKAAMYHHAVLAADPKDVSTLHNLGSTYNMGGKYNEAIDYYSQVLKLQPNAPVTFFEMLNLKMTMCDWRNYDKEMEKLHNIVRTELLQGRKSTLASWYAVNYPLDGITLKKIAHNYGMTDHYPYRQAMKQPFTYPKKLKPGEKLRVGIVTADAGETNVGRDIVGWFRHHNEEESGIELYLFVNKPPDSSAYFADIRKHCDKIFEIHALLHPEAAELIHSKGIHILINLNGYTKYSRNEVFAMQPSPIQVNFKGYPGTLGVDWIHYILGDKITTPFENEEHFSEKIVHMPYAYFMGSYPDVFPHVIDTEYMRDFTVDAREKWGLPRDKFIFADFNHLRKLYKVWMNILQAVPDSVLWLLRLPDEAEVHLKREAEARGVEPDRIIFTDFAPIKDHLAVKSLADLFLDTTVFNAHGTAMDNFWAGLPILTVLGDMLHSRVSANFCTVLGVPELIASDMKDYERKAINWATDALAGGNKLKDIRKKIEEKRMTSALFDTKRWVSDWQNAMMEIWRIYEKGEKPRHTVIPETKNWSHKISDWMPKKSDFFRKPQTT